MRALFQTAGGSSVAASLVLAGLFAGAAQAGTVTDTLAYDNSAGENAGGNLNVADFVMSGAATDGDTGVAFTYDVRLTGLGGTLRTNGGTTNREFGITGATGNNAIDQLGEGVQYAVENIVVTDFNGLNPADVSVNFDEFTAVILFFVDNDGDAAYISDSLEATPGAANWSFEGSIVDGIGSTDDSLITPGVSGFSASNSNNAQIDVSGFDLTTLVVGSSGEDFVSGAVDPNRIRTDDITSQFTVTVVPEPASLALSGLGGLCLLARRRRSA